MTTHTRTFTIRWADCDANGHLRNTGYSEYAIEVRMAWLAQAGFGLEELRRRDVSLVLLREEIDYLREVLMGEVIEVDFTALGLSADGTRFKVAHEIRKQDGRPAARLVITGGWFDLSARRLAPPPPDLRAIFETLPRGEGFEVLPDKVRRS